MAQADKAFRNEELKKALSLYEQVLAAQPNNLQANFQAGSVYLSLKQPDKAIPFLLKAATESSRYRQPYFYNLARAYHLNSNFEEAIPHYRHVISKTSRKEEMELFLLEKRIQECQHGIMLVAKPTPTLVRNLGAPLNSAHNDHVPLLTGNDEGMYFTSRRKPASPNSESTEDVYFSSKTGETWSEPRPLGPPINTDDHDAATCISADGKTLYLYRDTDGGDIYKSTLTGPDAWSKPEPLPKPINSDYYEPSFFIVNDNQYAFFSSDREGGFGGLDIYLTMRQPDGSWSDAMNLGANINTPFDEDAPFIADDGVTLYFSSQGHNSMGGFDLFKSSSEGAAWEPARNLGSPINTPFDDIFFTATSSGQVGYFSSDRPGGLGGTDIYEAVFRSFIATDSLAEDLIADVPVSGHPPTVIAENSGKPVSNTVLITGTVSGAGSGTPLNASLVLTVSNGNMPAQRIAADSLSGKFTFTVEKGRTYQLTAHREGYFFADHSIKVPADFSGTTITRDIRLNRIEKGSKIVLRNIFFEYNKDVISDNSKQELERLYQMLEENKNLRIEISGHTDNRGKPEYNQALSLRRAASVRNYLINRGIAAERMKAVGMGSTRPIASNQSEDGRRQNRRTEFKVTGQ